MVSNFTSLNRNMSTLPEQRNTLKWIFVLCFSFVISLSGLQKAHAQCNLIDFTGGNPQVTLVLDANGQAVLNQAALVGIIHPQGVGCSLFFYDYPAQAIVLGPEVIISCNGSSPYGPGKYFVVADDDGSPGGNESNPMVLEVFVTDGIGPDISGGSCGMTITANTSDDGIDDCATSVSFDAPVITENCYTNSTVLTITYSNGSPAPMLLPVNEVIFGAALQDSVAIWTTTPFSRKFYGANNNSPGRTNVTFTISDGSNSPEACSVLVEVTDDEAPKIICPSTLTVSTGAGVCTTTSIPNINIFFRDISTIDAFNPLLARQYTDNCGVQSIEYMLSGSTTLSWISGTNAGAAIFNLGLTTVTYRITDYAGNSTTCSFDIRVIDNTPPSLTCPANIVMNTGSGTCTAVATWPTPTPTDNCDPGGASILLSSSHSSGSTFQLGVTTVTYRAVDNAGNESTCSFTVTVTDNQKPIINCPADQAWGTTCPTAEFPNYSLLASVTDNCSSFSVTQSPAAGTTATAIAGMGLPVYVDNGTPGLDVNDSIKVSLFVTDLSGGAKDTCMFYVVLDNYAVPIPDTPGVNLMDLNASCGGITLIAPTATDFNCPPNKIYGVPSISGGAVISPLNGPPTTMYSYTPTTSGTVVITWAYSDVNTVVSNQFQTVVNNGDNPPSIDSYLSNITVNLDANGQASIDVNDFFVAASDDCSTPSLSVNPFSFDCGNIGNNAVTISANDGINPATSVQATVTVQDQIIPVLLGVPPSATVECDAVPSAPLIGTDIIALDNCSGTGILLNETSNKSGNPDFCSDYSYTITRTWTATDVSGNAVAFSQTITVQDTQEPIFNAVNTVNTSTDANSCATFVNYEITALNLTDNCAPFANIDLSYTIDLDDNGIIDLAGSGGDVSRSYGQGTHEVVFTATDPCGNSETHTLIINVVDSTPPIASCLGGAATVALPPSDTLIIPASFIDNGSFDHCDPFLTYSLSRDTFTCIDAGLAHFITMTVTDDSGNSSSCNAQINIQDNIPPSAICQDITVSLDASGSASISAADLDGGSFDNCTGTVSGTGVLTFTASQLLFGPGDVGVVPVELYVRDALGNRDTCISNVTVDVPQTCFDVVEDLTSPPGFVNGTAGTVVQVPVVVTNFINVQSFQFKAIIMQDTVAEFDGVSNNTLPGTGLTVNIESSDTVTISWFNNSSSNNPATLADGTTVFFLNVLLTGDVSESTTIKLIGDNAVPIEVIRNYSGTALNTAPCVMDGIVLIDNPAQLTIAGTIRDFNGATVGQATVDLTDQTIASSIGTRTTGAAGTYNFFPVPAGRDYKLTPTKDFNWINGVSAFDLSLIQRHIVGIDTFTNPYQKVAADALPDNSITTFDVVNLHTLLSTSIPGPPVTPPGNTSWRFVDADFVFPNAIRRVVPVFPECIVLPNLQRDSLTNDFVAVKVGDVEGNANPLTIIGNDPADGRFGQFNIHLEDRLIEAGETYELVFRADAFDQLIAYQWVLEFDPFKLAYEGAEFGVLNNFGDNNIGQHGIEQGLLSMIWYDVQGADLKSGDALFTLTFRALEDADQLSELIAIGEYGLTTSAFKEDGAATDIKLNFAPTQITPTADGFELYQNTPNPFRDQTMISFQLPAETHAQLSIMDVSGRVVKVIDAIYPGGYNEVAINRSDLPSRGVLYYQLDSPDNSAIRKMIILD